VSSDPPRPSESEQPNLPPTAEDAPPDSLSSAGAPRSAPLDQMRSVKAKLGLLVAVSTTLASVLAAVGAVGSVPVWLSIPVTVALALAVTQLLAVGMTSPLREMTAAARGMARGDYSVRVTASSSDEVGELGRAFNRMAEDLAAVDRQRRELVANVSHELRTPLTALCAVLENLVDGVAEPDPVALRTALDQAERLSALASDLLDLARVDAGKAKLTTTQVAVQDLLDRAVAEARVTGRQVRYDVRVTPAALTVPADPARLQQLIANLLDNASRHSPAGGEVRITARQTPDGWRLEVADDGPGIPAADRDRVFERFGTLAETDGGGGTGLGLAIARWVTDLHGGTIHFVDPEPNRPGARVRVDLPNHPRPLTQPPSVDLPNHSRPFAQASVDPPQHPRPPAQAPGVDLPHDPRPLAHAPGKAQDPTMTKPGDSPDRPNAGSDGAPDAAPNPAPPTGEPAASPAAGRGSEPLASPSAGRGNEPVASPAAGRGSEPLTLPSAVSRTATITPPGPGAGAGSGPGAAAGFGPAGATRVPESGMDLMFGKFWPDARVPGSLRAVLWCLGVGLLAGIILPFRDLGLGTFVVLVAAGGVVFGFSVNRRSRFTLTCAALCLLLAATVAVRDAEWIAVLCLLAGGALCMAALVNGRSVPSFVLAGISWPLAGLRGLPWLGRSARAVGGLRANAAMVRTVALSALGVLVFGLLFSSADAVFGEWMGAIVPDLELDSFVLRAFITVAVGGVVLAATYLGLNPPNVEVDTGTVRPVARRYEWLAPVLLVDGVFLIFLAAQATVIFGGHDYLERITGLTYAEYVHQGFGQLTVATALTLLVVWAAARKAPRTSPADVAWLRGSLGLLCALTLVVVASALYRMHVYQEAYGFTELRLLVDVFEGWLGLLVIGVMVAGLSLKAGWLPRAALLSGAGLLLMLAAINPDAWIAQHNVDRYTATGKVDWWYLQSLSDDAVPVLVKLPDDVAHCALSGYERSTDDWLEWNLGRHRAHDLISPTSTGRISPDPTCPTG
jgi:signal transduction histidine kinase